MECKYKRICEVMAGLGGVEILEASEPLDGALLVEVRTVGGSRRLCPGCGGRVWSKGERLVEPAGSAHGRAAGAAGLAETPVGVP